MICPICGEVKNDWGNSKMCKDCWVELHNE